MKNLKKALAVSCAGLLLFAPYNYPIFPEILTAYAEATSKDVSTGDITIDTGGEYSISGETSDHKIIISESCTVTLTGVKINLTSGSPITIAEGKTVTLILSGENTLSSGDSSAIVVNSGAKLIIQIAEGTSGTLNATGSGGGADIGGEGSIEIQSGTVNATITSGDVEINNGAIVNDCVYPSSYTITIPQSIDFRTDRSATVSLSRVNIEDDKKISVKLSSTNADKDNNKFYLKDGDNQVEYVIKSNDTEVKPEGEILTVQLTFEPQQNQIKYTGSYTDTLTFTVSMENATG